MAENSKIEWTHHTFNPWWGCVKVSPACDNCYAETFARRVGFSDSGSKFPIWGKDTKRRFFGDKHWSEPLKWNRDAEKAGERRRVFCGSMCDVMEDHGDLQHSRVRLYNLICDTPHLDWLLLTKRPQNFRRFLPPLWIKAPRPNVWGMTTVESPDYFWRVKELTNTPFAVRGLSMEPLLADCSAVPIEGIHWVIVGGESGHGERPMHQKWAQTIRDRCVEAGVPFLFKQWGNWIPCRVRGDVWEHVNGPFPQHIGKPHDWKDGFGSVYVRDKHSAGRMLNGRTWDEYPTAARDETVGDLFACDESRGGL